MEYLWVGLCGLLVIIGLVCVVMSRTIWRWPQMVVMVFILLSSVAFFYLAARTLKLRQNWAGLIAEYHKEIDRLQPDEPRPGTPSLLETLAAQRNDLRRQYQEMLNMRGRVWADGQKGRFDPQTSKLTVSFENPPPGLGSVQRPVFVFQKDSERDKRGKYLGEFVVSSANDREVILVPAHDLIQAERNTIDAAKGDLAIYEMMPLDVQNIDSAGKERRNKLFASADPADLKAWSGGDDAFYADYKRDGQPATADDEQKHPENVWVRLKFLQAWTPPAAGAPAAAPGPAAPAAAPPAEAPAADDANKQAPPRSIAKDEVRYLPEKIWDPKSNSWIDFAQDLVDKKIAEYDKSEPEKAKIYARPLRDYAHLFRSAYRTRNELFAQTNEIKAQNQQVDAALANLDADVKSTKEMTDGLNSDLTNFKAELDIVDRYAQALDAKLKKTRQELSATYRQSLKLAADLTEAQRQLSQKLQPAPAPQASAAMTGAGR